MIHRFHPEALDEWHAAAAYYESQREGLGVEFIEAVRGGIESILEGPNTWPVFTQSSRAYRLTRFPYRLVYEINESVDEVLIASVMHTKRDKGYVEKRLR